MDNLILNIDKTITELNLIAKKAEVPNSIFETILDTVSKKIKMIK